MKKDINHITEELIMRYVEGDLSHEESKEFDNMLSKNEYLRKRVIALQNIIMSQPLESPSIKTHNDILKKLNIDTHESHGNLSEPGYFSDFFEKLMGRPFLLAGSVSCLVITLVIFSVVNNGTNMNNTIDNSISSEKTDQSSEMADKDEKDEKAKDEKVDF